MSKLKSKITKSQINEILLKANYNIRKSAELATGLLNEVVSPQLFRYWVETISKQESLPEPKILSFDIETAPMKVYTWGLWNQNINIGAIIQDWYVLCWSAKWLDDNKVYNDALYLHPGYEKEDDCEFQVIESIWQKLNECDIAVAQNGKRFDKKKLNAKFLQYGFPEPVYKLVDTLLIAKGNFAFSSNKLDHISKFLEYQGKDKTDFGLWIGCMEGDKNSWKKMVKYCDRDVLELEKVYMALRPWDKNHPSYGMYTDDEFSVCNICGHKDLVYEKDYHTNTSTFEVYRCEDCGHTQRTRKNVLSKEKRESLMMNVR